MSDTRKPADEGRRNFLKLAATAAPAAAAAAVTGHSAEAAEAPESKGGMPDTEHVRKYLDSARF